ncbi:bifunctional phosphopantothenoylcysteine decarboxylase/phosphopantothenate--cysteine ligase CoaBC [Saliterribacillus persicus]|uniref:Coenzyme A biosynthesis bifunctional protein CoaBC n=1 Tax=Saliterribacillus persicus TaxID=930114 RepID=A0A368XUC9_9BACI|nr:bifunctional phosphopantothenoylcysteine decarboxylase/phosphopantothenate--cysteine ligase CoaBC [Saliterribacillus persicus]RCW70766.1 phosphopantothenate-cysteine ligase /phosphopantothenoylcysteine decarboxylase [Saliterribacillus persicus]
MGITGKRIVLGVTGGIAAYKACALTSKLTQAGADVKVIMTQHAIEFVSPLTFQAISRNPVYTDTFDEKDPAKIAHIDLADWADFFIIAPTTANMIAKIANGIADDMLSTTLLATEAPVYIAPAMNVHMYKHPAVIKNMKQLEEYGYLFIEPGDGYLACGYVGKGRLEEPEEIVRVLETQYNNERLAWKNKKVIVTAGPTREKIDPVRFFTNYSSGKMGYAIAEAAQKMGANVILISGPTNITTPTGIEKISVMTAKEMHEALLEVYDDADIVIKAAAVADYRPKDTFEQKMKKKPGSWMIEMERTTDILGELGKTKKDQYLVGFAAETENVLENGLNKLKRKNLNAIVINDISKPGAGFSSDTNAVTIITESKETKTIALAEKSIVADEILKVIDGEIRKDKK